MNGKLPRPIMPCDSHITQRIVRIAVDVLLLCFLLLCVLLTTQQARADWPQFRGPAGLGHADGKGCPVSWSLLRNIFWQTATPGEGWSSPIIVGDRLWITSAETIALEPEARTALLAKFADDTESFGAVKSVTLYAIELDVADGRMLRKVKLAERENPPPIHAANRFASATPCTDGVRLYCHFGTLGAFAVDLATGKVAWEQRLEYDFITNVGSSPILCDSRLILTCDGAKSQFVAALDARTGTLLWKTSRPPAAFVHEKHGRSFSTPVRVKNADREEVIVPGSQWLVSYNPVSGAEHWRVNFGEGRAVAPSPVHDDRAVYFCTGYPKPQLWAVRLGGAGDVSESHVEWIYDRQAPELASPLLVDGLIYVVSIVGVANCVEAASGERVWTQRLGGRFGASPLFVDGKIYFTTEEGLTTVVQPGRVYRELARNQAPGIHLASPAPYADSLIFRSSEGLYRVRELP